MWGQVAPEYRSGASNSAQSEECLSLNGGLKDLTFC